MINQNIFFDNIFHIEEKVTQRIRESNKGVYKTQYFREQLGEEGDMASEDHYEGRSKRWVPQMRCTVSELSSSLELLPRYLDGEGNCGDAYMRSAE